LPELLVPLELAVSLVEPEPALVPVELPKFDPPPWPPVSVGVGVAVPVPAPDPPVGGTGATTGVVAGAVVAGGVVAGVVVADSTGWVVETLGLGFFEGVGLGVTDFDGTRVDSSRAAGATVAVAVRRGGSASVTSNDLGEWLALGPGIGLGRAGGLSSLSSLSRPGRGRTALERTGPPARLTLIRPP
jgi:hypothetical protein